MEVSFLWKFSAHDVTATANDSAVYSSPTCSTNSQLYTRRDCIFMCCDFLCWSSTCLLIHDPYRISISLSRHTCKQCEQHGQSNAKRNVPNKKYNKIYLHLHIDEIIISWCVFVLQFLSSFAFNFNALRICLPLSLSFNVSSSLVIHTHWCQFNWTLFQMQRQMKRRRHLERFNMFIVHCTEECFWFAIVRTDVPLCNNFTIMIGINVDAFGIKCLRVQTICIYIADIRHRKGIGRVVLRLRCGCCVYRPFR